MNNAINMQFRRVGRTHQLQIESTADLLHVLALDKAHWVATGAPVEALRLDPQLLQYVDSDVNRRIMCFEIRDAIRWTLGHLTDTSGVEARSTRLALSAINREAPDGERIATAAEKLLRQTGDRHVTEISLETVRTVKSRIEARPVSEAGVILPEAVQDAGVQTFLKDIIATVGGVEHPTGSAGVNREKLEVFRNRAATYLEWLAKGETQEGGQNPIRPFGADTDRQYALLGELTPKIEQFFAQCQAIALDERAALHIHPLDEDFKAADLNCPEAIRALMREAPLAPLNPEGVLDLHGRLNPAYAEACERFRDQPVKTILGDDIKALTVDGWKTIRDRFAAHAGWLAARTGSEVATLSAETLRAYLDPGLYQAVEQLIARSARTAIALDNVRLLERLVLSQAYLMELVNNFVSFPHLYDPGRRASFEMGTLTIDGRHLTFSLEAINRTEHARIAQSSDIFVVYAEVLETDGSVRCTVALPVTSGGKGNLVVGKRGVFQDTNGREFDARVVQILSNPISLKETLLAPFQRLGKLLSDRIESMTSAAEKKLDATATQALDTAGKPPAAAPAASEAGTGASRGLFAGGLLMGGGVAVAALTSAVAYISSTVAKVGPFKILGGVLIAVLAVAIPASLVALFKLRRRDLSAILEGAGWAINARMRLTFKQGRLFTRRPPYPKGAKGVQHTWQVILLVMLLIGLLSQLSWLVTSPWRHKKLSPAQTRQADTEITDEAPTP